jgi:hypothetical protein
MFGSVEEFILPYVVDHARPELSGDDYRMQALLQFAGEESKHIQLFKRFRQEFENGFGSKCDFIGPAEDVRRFVASHSPLGVGIAILHIEWLILRHYIEGVRDNQNLDPQFTSLLKHHWLEEWQHTKLDTLIVESIVKGATAKEIDQAFAEYAEIGTFIDDGIKQQAEFEADSFVQATGRILSRSEREEMTNAVLQGMRWTYLGSGMTHLNFLTRGWGFCQRRELTEKNPLRTGARLVNHRRKHVRQWGKLFRYLPPVSLGILAGEVFPYP